MDRRAFVGRSVRICTRLATVPLAVGMSRGRTWSPNDMPHAVHRAVQRPLRPDLRIALVTAAGGACRQGVEMGVDESRRAAQLLGGRLEVAAVVSRVRDVETLVGRDRVAALITDVSGDATAELARLCAREDVLLLNATATDDALRNERCSRHAFHIAASDAMLAAAEALATADGLRPSGEVAPALWDPKLERFGGAQLNARFEARFQSPMRSAAWAGWFAVKVAWEVGQRATVAPGAPLTPTLIAYLERDTTQFDGQKGLPLSFRPWDHQLRQPLYVTLTGSSPDAPGSLVAAPTVGEAPARVALDRLGTAAGASRCTW